MKTQMKKIGRNLNLPLSVIAPFAVVLLGGMPAAVAANFFHTGLYYGSETVAYDGAASSTSTRTLMDVGGGYVSTDGWVLGLNYTSDKTSTTGSDTTLTGVALMAGYATKKEQGGYILANYYPSMSRSTDNAKGTAYKVDVGYKLPLSKVSIAPQLSYRVFNIAEDPSNGVAKATETRIDPMITVWIDF